MGPTQSNEVHTISRNKLHKTTSVQKKKKKIHTGDFKNKEIQHVTKTKVSNRTGSFRGEGVSLTSSFSLFYLYPSFSLISYFLSFFSFNRVRNVQRPTERRPSEEVTN